VSDDEELAKRTGQKRMAEAMDAVDEALEAYIYRSRHGGVGQARERLHVAVMTLFSRMEPHLETHDEGYTDMSDCRVVDGETLYQGRHPQTGTEITLTGLRDLGDWRVRKETVPAPATGPNSFTDRHRDERVVRLPGEALVKVVQVLRHYYVEFGLGLDTSIEQQTHIDDDLIEEVKQWRKRNI
jgi:hypothetical protein